MEKRFRNSRLGEEGWRRAWLAALALLTLAKLWLDSALRIKAEPSQAWDDGLYVRLAQSLLSGDWLGPYDQFTLIKSPLYPAWLALVHGLGVPLLLAQSALYAGVGLVLIRELRRAGMSRIPLLLLYGIYLFNPMVEVRVLREGAYTSLLVLLLAALLRLRRGFGEGTRSALFGSILLGVTLAAVWLTREEGLLVLPAVGIFYLAFLAGLRSPGATPRGIRLLALLVPFLVLGAATQGASLANARRYGVYAITEQNSSAFASAFGSMMRVEQPRPIPYVLVPWTVRIQLYQVSPTLASIQSFLDGNQGALMVRRGWLFSPCRGFIPCPDYAGLWVMWALRQAASDAGHHASGEEAMQFYRRIADEISRACDTHALKCGPPRDSIIPPWRSAYGPDMERILVRGWATVLSVPVRPYVLDPDTQDSVSEADPVGLERFSALTGNRLLPAEGSADAAAQWSRLDREKLSVLRGIARLYQGFFPFLVYAGAAAFLIALPFAIWRLRGSVLLLVATALLVSIVLRLFVLSFIEVSMFPAFANWPAYITPLYPLLVLFAGLSLAELSRLAVEGRLWVGALRESSRQGGAPPEMEDA
jgi:hypothetical protein